MKFFNQKKVMTMSDRVAQIVKDTDVELQNLNSEYDDAIDSFRSTVNKIDTINSRIDSAVAVMDQQITSLTNTRQCMISDKLRNERVKSKIEEFLV